MSMETLLGNITQRLRGDAFPNEQSISQGIVLPVLQKLHWPVFETNFVHPEYATGEGRVDFALCDPPQRPKVFKERDELLVDLLAETTESKAGIRPENSDVMDFLDSLQKSVLGGTTQPICAAIKKHPQPPGREFEYRNAKEALAPQSKSTDLQPSRKAARSQPRMPRHQGKVIIGSREFEYRNAKEAMVLVLRELQRRDPNFLPRLSQHPKCRGRTRRFIAQSPEELYPDPRHQNMNESLPGGWFVATDNGSAQKKEFIEIASEVAGLKFGRDIVIDW